jgi:SPP1 gp7 family putative phage head morphogenesis protein
MADRIAILNAILRREIRAALKASPGLDRVQLLAKLRSRIRQIEPHLARTLRDDQLIAFVTVAAKTLLASGVRLSAPVAEPFELPPAATEAEPLIRFPQIEKAAEFLRSRIAFTPDEFAALSADAQKLGFTVARLATEDSIRTVRDALSNAIAEGGAPLKQFQRDVADAVAGSGFGNREIEALYRTHVGRAQAAGQLAALEHPLVADEFPYRMYSATHDGRVREEHLMIERLGLNGTAVFRADDPIWEKWYPPCGWNCRCSVIAMTVEDAAAMGVKEAIRWMKTGIPPEKPEWVKPFPFELPKGWVPTGRSLELAV